ncbi:hypothetical protein ES319_A10G080100v1 [Gossypium barbadense]|uniref:Lipoyl-binding domain-containing protein n=1 Tax=Gossypium barbadense TaxID=3634 RepID=A0A5J5U2C3_GOSBA|nr:hypothetical protein ES319_A10G080100v1 [Gossypium barbadense]
MILKKLKCLVRLASLFQIHLGWNLWSEIYAVQLPLQKLKLGGFWLYIVRNLAGKSEPPPPILSPPPVSVSTNKTVEAPKSNGTVSTPSLAITRPLSSSGRIESFLDKAADEGLVILQSPKKQIVKEGKVLCYIEQLGCEIPIAV